MKQTYSFLLIPAVLLVGALACKAAGNLDPTGENAVQTEAVGLVQAAGTQTQLARPTATRTRTPTPRPTSTPMPTSGPLMIDDSFDSLDARWQSCTVCTVKAGRLIMGPYPASNSARGYIALCKDCGIVREYKMSVDASFLSGASDRGYGLMLREWGGDYIGVEITTWQVYGVWFFDSKKEDWYTLLEKGFMPTSSLRPGAIQNHIDVEVMADPLKKDKDVVKISINRRLLNTIEIPKGDGYVGLAVGLHSIAVAFDNFHFEGTPSFDVSGDHSG